MEPELTADRGRSTSAGSGDVAFSAELRPIRALVFDRDILNGNDSCLSVRIHECRPTTIHAKTFVVDGAWSAVGTMNFDNRSLACNDGIALVALDDTVGRGASGLEGDRPAVRVS